MFTLFLDLKVFASNLLVCDLDYQVTETLMFSRIFFPNLSLLHTKLSENDSLDKYSL